MPCSLLYIYFNAFIISKKLFSILNRILSIIKIILGYGERLHIFLKCPNRIQEIAFKVHPYDARVENELNHPGESGVIL